MCDVLCVTYDLRCNFWSEFLGPIKSAGVFFPFLYSQPNRNNRRQKCDKSARSPASNILLRGHNPPFIPVCGDCAVPTPSEQWQYTALHRSHISHNIFFFFCSKSTDGGKLSILVWSSDNRTVEHQRKYQIFFSSIDPPPLPPSPQSAAS